ncbi:hypothetical protein VTN02DRAFT_3676 [Thermoascus thermophilus]
MSENRLLKVLSLHFLWRLVRESICSIYACSSSACVSSQVGRMPYTAPLQLSSPAHRHHNFASDHFSHHDSPESIPRLLDPPHLPRSYSSTSYVHRHRRSPSVSKPVNSAGVESSGGGSLWSDNIVDPNASLRPSTPPQNNAAIPNGALMSPPEFAINSSDDEEPSDTKSGTATLAELKAAIRSTHEKNVTPIRSRNMEKVGDTAGLQSGGSSTPSTPSEGASRALLSNEGRRISHARSSTEPTIANGQTDSLSASPSDSDRDDEIELSQKPPMVRKKSGELVRPALRPASARRRPSSMPGTPTFSKAVHFDSQLEHIRHFLQLDKPLAVSADTSPIEDYNSDEEFPFGNYDFGAGSKAPSFAWELRLVNFPRDPSSRAHMPVRLERIFLSSDNNHLIGSVAVANLAFQKHVVARFTLDYWKTISEVAAEYNDDVRRKDAHDGYDRFNFSIKLSDQANLEKKTMFVCIRYYVNGQEFWDNNNSMNYHVDFIKKPKTKDEKHSVPTLGGRPTLALPRSRVPPVSNTARPRSMPPSFDEFPSGIDRYRHFSRASENARSQTALWLTESASLGLTPEPLKQMNKPSRPAFGNRYDFGASLSAAIQTKKVVQDRTTLSVKATKPELFGSGVQQHKHKPEDRGVPTGKVTPINAPCIEVAYSEISRPSSLLSNKPHHESSVYKELVDKYCFYGSSRTSFSISRPASAAKAKHEAGSVSNHKNAPSNAVTSSSPSHRETTIFADPAVTTNSGHSSSPSSPSSPSLSSRSSSPVAFGFPYPPPMPSSFLAESQTPTAIQG